MITKKESPPQETYAEKIEREKSETEEGMRLYALARDEKDMTYCDAIRLPSLRTSCADMVLSTRAQDEKKSELCEVITDTGAESRCRDNILFFLATEIQDIASCGRIGDEHIRANCVEALEEKTYDARVLSGSLDRPFCDSLMTDSLRANCE